MAPATFVCRHRACRRTSTPAPASRPPTGFTSSRSLFSAFRLILKAERLISSQTSLRLQFPGCQAISQQLFLSAQRPRKPRAGVFPQFAISSPRQREGKTPHNPQARLPAPRLTWALAGPLSRLSARPRLSALGRAAPLAAPLSGLCAAGRLPDRPEPALSGTGQPQAPLRGPAHAWTWTPTVLAHCKPSFWGVRAIPQTPTG